MPAIRIVEPRPPMPGDPASGGTTSGGGPALDLSRPRRIHVVGAGGAGMSAIASVLAAMGHVVTGSDLKSSPALERLAASGVTVFVGHDGANVAGSDIVAISTAIPAANPEIAGPTPWPPSRRAGVPWRSRGRTARPPPPRCWRSS
jgi:hypothetical protein